MTYFDFKFSFLHIFTLQLLCIAHVRAVPSLQSLSARQSNVSQALDWDTSKTPFPVVRRDDTTFTYISASKGNVTVADPYNWFEQVDAEKDEIEAFRETQISFTKEYLKNVKESDQIHISLEQAKNCTQVGIPSVYGVEGSLLYVYTVVEANQTNTIYYIANQDEMDEAVATNFTHFPGKPYFDTALLGVNRTIYGIDVSPDGKKVLYTVFETEYNLDVWTYVRDISNPLTAETTTMIEEGGKGHYPDVISKAPIADWAPDSESIIYVHNDIRNSNITYNRDSIRYHKLGTDVKDDVVIVPEPSDVHHFFNFIITDDLRYFVVLYGQEVDGRETSRLYATSLDQPIDKVSEWKWIPITVDDSSDYFMMTNIGEDFYFNSRNGSAPRKIVHFSLDFEQAEPVKNLIEDLTENIFPVQILIDRNFSNGILVWTTFDTNKVMIEYDENDRSELLVYDLFTGKLLQNTSVDAFSAVNNLQSFPTAKDIYVSASPLDCPNKLYKMEWDSEKNQTKDLQLFYQASSNFITPENFVVERKWIPSTDGVQIPATFLHRKELQLDGTHPSLIEIYGGYGISNVASFNFLAFALAHSYDVVYVLAGIRGGGELGGEAWHKAGMLGNKHHSFEDTIATANYLVDQKYSSPGKILLYGEASGAMSSAAVINQAPQGLFGALVTYRGIFDMLRMDKSPGEGKGRVAEYGDPHNPKDFDWLYAYSPLHNIQKDKKYPIIVLIPGKDDDFAEPWHLYKYISTLQYLLPSNPNPILMTDSHQDADEEKVQAFEVVIYGIGLQHSSKS